MKILIYDKKTGKLDSLREYDSPVDVKSVFEIIYGGNAVDHKSTKEVVVVNEIPEFSGKHIVDVETKKVKDNPNYVPPSPSAPTEII